jgi:carboxymethylenebutenolidase
MKTVKYAGGAVAGLCLVLAGVPAGAADRAVETSVVTFPGGAGPIKGYLARPKGDGPFPGVVVVHEWWGLSDWVKQNADRLAAQGYAALAVDLYGGKVTADPGEAHELMRALDPNEGLADLKGGVAYLAKLPFVARDRKLGAIGWCMGGMYSRLVSQASDAVGPTVICYGSVATEPAQVARLAGKPLLLIFGETDRGIPAQKVKQFAEQLKQAGAKDVTVEIYAGAGHGFMRPGGPQHNAQAAADAWKKIDGFFAAHLKP